jgi:hypothetical protein
MFVLRSVFILYLAGTDSYGQQTSEVKTSSLSVQVALSYRVSP